MRNIYAETAALRQQLAPVPHERLVRVEAPTEFKIRHIGDENPTWSAEALFATQQNMRPY